MQSTSANSTMTVVQPCGHINAANAAALKRQLAETVSSHEYSSLFVDMSRVESLDSAGLMALVSTLTLAQRLNKRFGLCSVSPSIRIIFELTQLDRVFEISEHRPALEAVAA
jgi:anti-sigma B factor antagonist